MSRLAGEIPITIATLPPHAVSIIPLIPCGPGPSSPALSGCCSTRGLLVPWGAVWGEGAAGAVILLVVVSTTVCAWKKEGITEWIRRAFRVKATDEVTYYD